jgi:beta-galactosidase/beta-glucuronidase
LARLYVRLWSGQLFVFYVTDDQYSEKFKYPANDAFLANVKLEAEQNVQRLRHHPSIVILAGNNEGRALVRIF